MSKIFFKSFSNFVGNRCCPVGSPEQPVFMDSLDEKGRAVVVQTGFSNLDDYIQSFRDDTDIYRILDRLQLSGGELPTVPVGSFADITGVPDNIHEAVKAVNHAKYVFSTLSKEQRANYNNNFNEFISDFGSEKFVSMFIPDKNVSLDKNVSVDNNVVEVGEVNNA